jgi:hypothetical protein
MCIVGFAPSIRREGNMRLRLGKAAVTMLALGLLAATGGKAQASIYELTYSAVIPAGMGTFDGVGLYSNTAFTITAIFNSSQRFSATQGSAEYVASSASVAVAGFGSFEVDTSLLGADPIAAHFTDPTGGNPGYAAGFVFASNGIYGGTVGAEFAYTTPVITADALAPTTFGGTLSVSDMGGAGIPFTSGDVLRFAYANLPGPVTASIAAVPEPASWPILLLGCGVVWLGLVQRGALRRRLPRAVPISAVAPCVADWGKSS